MIKMDIKLIAVLGLLGLAIVMIVSPQTGVILSNNIMLFAVMGGMLLFGFWIYHQITKKPEFLPVATAKKNIVELCRSAKYPLGELITLGDADTPVITWGKISGFATGLKVAKLPVDKWTAFTIERPFPYSLFSEPKVVFIPSNAHTKLKANQNVYITAHSLVSYGQFLFPNTLFGTEIPLLLEKELVGYQMFLKLLDETGEVVERALFADSEHQRALERQKLLKTLSEGDGEVKS